MKAAAILCLLTTGCFLGGQTTRRTLQLADDLPDTHENESQSATGLDECALGLALCDPHASCVDAAQGYTCVCAPGWSGDGKTCAEDPSCTGVVCAENAGCAVTASGPSCVCNAGYEGEPARCLPASFQRVALASSHACAIALDGSLWCWGGNRFNQQLSNDKKPRTRPVKVSAYNDWTSVDTNEHATCGIRADGGLWCWGLNDRGQLGIDSQEIPVEPTRVAAPATFKTVSVGFKRTCALRSDGAAFCWGNKSLSPAVPPAIVPEPQGSALGWKHITTGDLWACGIASDDTLWCWGSNLVGELGDPLLPFSTLPAPIGTAKWRTLASGNFHTCGVQDDGSLWCWGHNYAGQTGQPNTSTNTLVPTRVGGDTDWTKVTASDGATCALRGTSLYCFGSNDTGRIGDGSFERKTTPTPPAALAGGWEHLSTSDYATCGLRAGGKLVCFGGQTSGLLADGVNAHRFLPARVGAGTSWLSVGTYDGHSCALRNDGSLWCWGRNDYGQAGASGLTTLTPEPVRLDTSTTWTDLRLANRTTCAMKNGKLHCFGDNAFGQILGAPLGIVTTPTPVTGSETWTAFAVGGHTCAIKADQTLWCWGLNQSGTVGNGNTTSPVLSPVQVVTTALPQTFVKVTASFWATCGIKTDGSLWCFGANSFGTLGIGAFSGDQPTPLRVGGANDWEHVSLSALHGCGLRSGGALYCWGMNSNGELGDGTRINRAAPTRVLANEVVSEVTAGAATTCALTTSGTLYCWGANGVGQVGIELYEPFVVDPTRVGAPGEWRNLQTTGGAHVCALKQDRSLWCWGGNRFGQLGLGAAWRVLPEVMP
ncbi:MAG: hypothetical protein IT381_10310 [Deltaproteobacteria bacterium]|nr:hypothetical protein [Deltaproteobacteria bacterium]